MDRACRPLSPHSTPLQRTLGFLQERIAGKLREQVFCPARPSLSYSELDESKTLCRSRRLRNTCPVVGSQCDGHLQAHGSRCSHQALRRSRADLADGARPRLSHLLSIAGPIPRQLHPGPGQPISRSARQVSAHGNHRRSRRPASAGMELHARALHHRPGAPQNPRRAHRRPPPGFRFRQAGRHSPGANPLRFHP